MTKSKKKQKYNCFNKYGGSGVILNANDKTAYDTFIDNATFKFLGSGSNGVSIIASLKPGIESPYKSLDESNYGGEIKTTLIKFIAKNHLKTCTQLGVIEINSAIKSDIVNELNIQTDIALKTLSYLEPICPMPIYYEDNISISQLNKMIASAEDSNTSEILTSIKNCIQNKRISGFSIIVMEFAKNYVRLFDVYTDNNSPYFYMTAYIILKLAIDTGYSHGDYHVANIMINDTKNNYFNGMTGSPLLIDFGFTTKIEIDKLETILNFIQNKEYTSALEVIGSIPRPDGLELDNPAYSKWYGYLLKDFQPDANQRIDELFRLREEAIQNTVIKFNELHRNNPAIPLLPLSNSAKKNIYSGTNAHNEIITVNYYFDPNDAKFTKICLDWIYDVIGTMTKNSHPDVDSKLQLFGEFCYNFIYLSHNVVPKLTKMTYQLYSMVALSFVSYFEWGEDEESSIDTMMYISSNAYSKHQVKNAIDLIYPMFENIEIESYTNFAIKYAIGQLNSKNISVTYKNIKPEILQIFTNKNFYEDPNLYNVTPDRPILPPTGQEYKYPYFDINEGSEAKTTLNYEIDNMNDVTRLGQRRERRTRDIPLTAERKTINYLQTAEKI